MTISVNLPQEIEARLKALADKSRPVDRCISSGRSSISASRTSKTIMPGQEGYWAASRAARRRC